MSSTPPTKATAYIWRARASEDSREAPHLEATNSPTPPAPRDDRVWRLLGSAHATALRDAQDRPTLKLWSPLMYGVQLGLDEVVRNGWYQKA